MIGKGLEAFSDEEFIGKESRRKSCSPTSKETTHAAFSDIKPKKRRSAEDIFYATINGEAISVADDRIEARQKKDYSDDGDEFEEYPDASSFACFDLIKEEKMAELFKHEVSISHHKKSILARQSGEGSDILTSEGSSEGETTTASSSIPSGDEDLSIEDIKHFVMEHLPDDVKNMISEDAWARILSDFNTEENDCVDDHDNNSAITTNSTKQALKRLLATSRPKKTKVNIEMVEGDHVSVVSEITTNTGTFKAVDAPKKVSFQTEPDDLYSNNRNKTFGYPSPLVESGLESFNRERKCAVNFGHVNIRYYEQILELNPSVTSGPPIGIGWNFQNGKKCTVDQWEVQKRDKAINRPRITKNVGPRSASSHLILPREARENILHDLGYTQKEIAQAIRAVRKMKDQRRTTVDNLNVQSVEEAVENATALMKNLLRVGKRRGLIR